MPERLLWIRVLLLAVEDATLGIGGGTGASNLKKQQMVEEARAFLTTPSEDLQIVCDGAGLDMLSVIDHMCRKCA